MAKQRYINTRFWDDGYISSLDPIEKLLFIYFLTNPLTEICGAYEIPLKRVALDTGIDRDMVQKILNRFADEDKIIYRDGWILVCNFIKHQSINPKVTQGIESAVNRCPDWIKDRLSIAYDSLSHLNLNKSNPIKSNSIEADTHPPAFPDPVFEYPIKNLVDAFPDYLPDRITPAMIGFYEAEVKPADAEAWRRTIEIYSMNFNPATKSYLPDKTANVLGVFRKQKTEVEREKNGSNKNSTYGRKRTDQDVLRESAEFYANWDANNGLAS